MLNLATDDQAMLAAWQQHTYAEFVLKDADATVATMTDNPYLLLVASGIRRVGRPAVRAFYANEFLPQLPPDIELVSLSQTFGDGRIVEEMVMRFTHSQVMDWVLPRIPPTDRTVELMIAGVIGIEAGKVAYEHLYWDQATLLSQIGVLHPPVPVAQFGSGAELLELSSAR
jgi:carboxymethylenebutenolidase